MQNVLDVWLNPDRALSEPANDDWVVMRAGETPAGGLQVARRVKKRLLRRLVREPRLLWDAEWRFTWHSALALERCLTWRYLEARWPWD
jgi:hypothetical protein